MADGGITNGIGAPVRRREDLRLLTGQGRFGDDLTLPGQAYATMLRSPHAHARIGTIDTAASLAVPGVLAVLTGQDMLADGLRPIPHAIWSGHPAEIALPNTDGSIAAGPPHFCMATGVARHMGDIVAVVIATSRAAAQDGAERVAVTYEPLAATARATDAIVPGAPSAWAESPTANVCIDSLVGDAAATDAAFAAAPHVVRFETWVQRVAGVPMEPRAAIGEYDPATHKYTLHAGAGGAVRPRNDLAAILGVPQSDVRMVMHDVGGNFGTRGAFNPEFALVVWAARRLGRPVKWTSDRSEAFLCDYQARDLAVTAELALDAQGTFLGLRCDNLSNLGAYPVGFSPLQKGTAIVSSIYHVPAVQVRARAAFTNTAPTRPYRSAGRPEVMYVIERLIDLAAGQTGLDRIELRRRNLIPESAMPYRNPFGLLYDSGAYRTVMETALRLGRWTDFPARRAEAATRGKCRGIGVANYVDTATGVPRERAEVTIKPEGVVEIVIGTGSQGQGHETSFPQLITEWLGVPNDSVRLVTGDTDRVKWGGGAHSGRALRLGSIVMHKASLEIIEKATRIASQVLEADRSDLVFAGGRFTVAGTDRSIGLFEVAAAALTRNDLPEDLSGALDAISDETIADASFPYGCHVCEVEADPETGVVTIMNYTAVDDVGRAVNPMIVHGQVHGGIAQGVGQALWEQVVYDRTTGQMLTGSFMDYAMPRASDLVSYATELSEVPCPTHPLGIRPAGEGGTTPALGVVANAVADALSVFGVTHVEMPMTPERVWRAIHGRQG
ncbi:MAG: xanthine dehydrogenase family protein molybdopterin-binding subunit [Acetobacteraceae bacterium]|nr:xanthine dehydrogenase family protein molybdopterin-binding subunit [Acetobacteraceae bacterium]